MTVGNTAPTVTLTTPADGQLFSFGDTVPFQVNVSDPEDGTIDCTKVTVTYLLGHDSHSHQITSKTGCAGSIAVPVDGEHDAAANIYGVFDGLLHRQGRPDLAPARVRCSRGTGRPSTSAPSRASRSADHASAEGGKTVGFIDNGDWISFQPYNLSNATEHHRPGVLRRARAARSRCARARPRARCWAR